MGQSVEQKIKLLVLYEILCRYTDEDHALNSDEIVDLLAQRKIPTARKVLVQDIKLLNDFGYVVLEYKKKYHYYYVVNRRFAFAEIAFLTDAISASKLSDGQKSSLLERLKDTLSEYEAYKIVAAANFEVNSIKRNNRMLYAIDVLKQAIVQDKQASFLYYSLNGEKEKIYHQNGKRYLVNPLAVIWNKDNYYLICYDKIHSGTANYRVDRIEDARIENSDRIKRKELIGFNAEEYRRQVFSMFGGEIVETELQFTEELSDEIFDKFGLETKVIKSGNFYRTTVCIQVSRTFFAWVAGTQGKVHILSPQSVKEEFKSFIDKIKQEY